MTSREFSSLTHARGAALFISLMFLIVLTLIGLSAANVGIMQERMAGNVRETNIAFQDAEAVLRDTEDRIRGFIASGDTLEEVEDWIDVQTSMGIMPSDCGLQEVADNDSFDSMDWIDSPAVTDGEYIVTELNGAMDGALPIGTACAPLDGQFNGKPIETQEFFLILARAPGPAERADTIVQSIYFWPTG